MSLAYYFAPHDLFVDPFDSFPTLIPSYRSYNRYHPYHRPIVRSLLARDHDRRLISRAIDELASAISDHALQFASILPSSIKETDKSYELAIDLPGVSKDAIDISIDDRVLTIKSERKAILGDHADQDQHKDKVGAEKDTGEALEKESSDDADKKSEVVTKKKQEPVYHHQEIHYGKITRSYTLPEDADESAIKAKYEDGVLHLEILKKTKQEEKVKRIRIE